MTAACTVNGTDLASLGVIVESVTGLDAWPSVTGTYVATPGWDGTRLASPWRTVGDRTLRLTALVDGRGGQLTTRLTALALLLEQPSALSLRFPARRSGLVWTGYLEGPRAWQAPAPDLKQEWVRCDLSFRCPDPYGYEESDTTVSVAATVLGDCALGTARALPLVRIVGPYTNPVLIHKTGAGVELGRITFTDTAASSATELQVLTDAGGEIRRVVSGVSSRADNLAAAGWWVPTLRPEYGTVADPQTLEVSSGALTVTYKKAYR